MKIKIIDVNKSEYTDKDGNPKYYVEDGNGEKHTTTDPRFMNKIGEVVEVEQQTGVYKGKRWSKITLKEEKAEEVRNGMQIPQEIWDKRELQIIRQHSQEMALKFYEIQGTRFTKEDVVALAEYFTKSVQEGLSEKTIETIKNNRLKKDEFDEEPEEVEIGKAVKKVIDAVEKDKPEEDKIDLNDIPF